MVKFLFLLVALAIFYECEAGNDRPYGVELDGVEGAGRVGQDASANGYAGSSLVAPAASEGLNSPIPRYLPGNSFPGNPSGIGFGGFGWRAPSTGSGY